MKRNRLAKGVKQCKGLLFIVIGLLLVTSCEPSYNEDIDGKWQLREIVDVEGVTHAVDTVWYNFQTSLFMYQLCRVYPDSVVYDHCYGYKTREDKKLLLLELDSYPRNEEEQGVNDFLPYTDWSGKQRSFVIEKHTGKKLILSSEGKQYRFDKF